MVFWHVTHRPVLTAVCFLVYNFIFAAPPVLALQVFFEGPEDALKEGGRRFSISADVSDTRTTVKDLKATFAQKHRETFVDPPHYGPNSFDLVVQAGGRERCLWRMDFEYLLLQFFGTFRGIRPT